MKFWARGIVKWATRLLLLLLAVGMLWIAPLVFPAPLFSHTASYGTYRVYSDEPIPAGFARVIEDLDGRIEGMEHTPAESRQRIYLCGSARFSFFAFLTRMNPESLAIGLSAANVSFVSMERVRLFAATNYGALRHTRFEGNLAEVVAHEIAHFHSVRALGYRSHLRQPLWKSEGWAEYQANLAAMHADPDYDLGSRIEQLLDDRLWDGGDGFARRMWESQLLVEFLGEVKGYRLTDIIREEVTESSSREQMMDWYHEHLGEVVGSME